jgi:hypothetical protein
MRRRDFLALTSAALIARSSIALAQRGRIPAVGVLWHAGSSFEEGAYLLDKSLIVLVSVSWR